jgi:hypothetical protein
MAANDLAEIQRRKEELFRRTGTTNHQDAFARIYTDVALMRWWVEASGPRTLRDRMLRTVACLDRARDMRGRFGVKEVPPAVVELLQALLVAQRVDAAALEQHILKLRGELVTWDEIWFSLPPEFEALGFRQGDAVLFPAVRRAERRR